MKFTKRIKDKIKGFTLIELLIAIGILSVLFAIVLLALNPLEQLNKARDVAVKSFSQDFASATKYYYTAEKTLPWKKDAACKDQLAVKDILSDMPSCIEQLTQAGKLQENVTNSSEAKDTYVTECSDSLAICYGPKSSQFLKNSDAKYTKNGVLNPKCPGSAECYSCEFTTNEAQECFQAMNPKGSLAIIPSPSPTELLPIPNRNSKQACSDTPPTGAVSCMGKVVTDSSGNPLSSISLPGGFGPEQLHNAYNLPCTPGGTIQSKCTSPSSFGPQTIAIVDAYHAPTLEADLAVYNQTYGLPPCTIANGCLTIVNQNGATSPVPPVDANWALETSLDVQMVHAICQTCKILVVEANTNYFTDLGVAVNRAAAMGATSISNSYGARDWSGQTTYDSYYNHPGIFVTASSGDWGYGTYYPSSSSHVIGVGGTTLSLFANNSYAAESVWSGTGSGCSPYATAQNFQTGFLNWNATGCGSKRGVADVAAVANPSTGVAVYNSTPYAGRSGWWILGGTSVSSPIISATLAMMENAPQGVDASSYVYTNSSKFRDVTTGSNGSCSGTTACTAGVGYDGPTGIGSPKLLADPVGTNPTPTPAPTTPPTEAPTFTPTPTIASSGADLTPPAPITTLTATISGTFINLSWKGTTDNIGVKEYRVFKDNTLITTALARYGARADDTQNTYGMGVGYQPSTTYVFYVRAVDVAGNLSQITQQVSITTPSTDLCTAQQTVTLMNSNPVLALPGDTINNSITVKNNDQNGCSSIFTVSKGFPNGWSISGLPASFSISGGVTQTFNFTVAVPQSATVGTYGYQIWVAKQGQNSVNPVNGSVQVQQLGPTNTPTPTPVTCTNGWSNSLGSTSMSGNPGDTLNQTITITNNNAPSCGSVLYTISYSYPSGWSVINLPASVTVTGGETKTIPFSIKISPQAQQNDYIMQYWVLSGSQPMNSTIHVLSSGPTITPTPTTPGITCGNLSPDLPSLPGQVKAYLYKDDASFNICQAPVSGYFEIDVSYDPTFSAPAFDNLHNIPDWTRWDRGACCQTMTGIAFAQNNTWGIPYQRYGPLASGLIIRPNNGGYGFIPANQVWANWQCGKTLYWRLSKMYDPTTVISPTYSAVISCDTPQRLYYGDWSLYYDGTKQVKYDVRWDANNNGVMDYDDYWILVDKDLVTTYR